MWKWKLKTLTIILTLVTTTSLWASDTPPTGWELLGAVTYEEFEEADGSWRVEKTFPAALSARADDFRISGYVVPIQAQAYITSFLLIENQEDCPFCGGGGYGPVLEVHMKRPLPDMPEFTAIQIRGTLQLIDDPETLQFARMVDGVLLDMDN